MRQKIEATSGDGHQGHLSGDPQAGHRHLPPGYWSRQCLARCFGLPRIISITPVAAAIFAALREVTLNAR